MENMKHAITFDSIVNKQKQPSFNTSIDMKEAIFFESSGSEQYRSIGAQVNMTEAIFFESTVKDEQNQEYTVKIPQALINEVPTTALTLESAKELGFRIDKHQNANIISSHCPASMERMQKSFDKVRKANESINNYQQIKKFASYSDENNNCSILDAGASSATSKILSTPENISFPQVPLPVANIYTPVPLDNSEFINTEVNSKDEHNNQLPVRIFKEIERLETLKAYNNDLYIFKKAKGVFQKLSSQELHYIINKYHGNLIEKQGNTASYYTAEDFLRKQNSLVIHDADFLPLDYWGFLNGFYNIYTGECICNNGSYFVRHVLQCNFQSEALCPNFDNYIYSIAAGDKRLITRLWEVIGYLLSNDTNGKAFIAFIGRKDTGKSLLANIISKIVGEDDICHLSANDFSGRFDVSELNGKQLNICMDLPDRALSPDAVGKIKSITGNDVIRSDVKHKESVSFVPTARLLFGSNAPIRTDLPDPAFYERLILIPFLYPVPKHKQDHRLEEKLVAEASGICLKAIEYYKKLRSSGYIFTEINFPDCLDTSINYDTVIRKFANEFCEFTQNTDDKISSDILYTTFKNFCVTKNITALNIAEFSKKFKDIFDDKVEKRKIKFNGSSLNGFVGVKLKGRF